MLSNKSAITSDFVEYVADMVTMMARFANQDIEVVSRWPISKLNRRYKSLARILELENKSSKGK